MADPFYATDFFPIASLVPALIDFTLSAPPFVQVEGIYNIRDFGAGYPTATGARVKSRLPLGRADVHYRGAAQGTADHDHLRPARGHRDRKILYSTVTPAIEGGKIVRASIIEGTSDPVVLAAKCVC